MSVLSAPYLSAIVTFLAVAFYFFCAMRVGVLRGRLGVKAPATSGHPIFDRAYRVQLNTLEQMGIFLPLLWLSTFYPAGPGWIAPLIGLAWILARIVYRASYMADPEKRVPGAMLSGLTMALLLILTAAGLIRAGLNGTY